MSGKSDDVSVTTNLGVTEDQTIRIDGCKFVVALPPSAGRICGLANYRGQLIITTDFGHLYAYDGERETLRKISSVVLDVWP